MKYYYVENESGANITVWLDGDFHGANSHQPNFNKIVEKVKAGDTTGLLGLFNPEIIATQKFKQLSDRVSIANGRIYFDGDAVDNILTKQILRFITEDVEDWQSLVNFYERLMTNLSVHTRSELYRWISDRDLEISPEGKFFAYKGLNADMTSIHAGPATVDGESVNGNVPNHVGSTVTFPRSSVDADSNVGCSTGLHAGTWEYAKNFSRGAIVKVLIDPVDVVSVPTDCADQKLRVCKYVVVEQVTSPSSKVVDDRWRENDDYYDPYYEDVF